MFIKINGEGHYLRRAVDQDGNALDIMVQSRRNKKSAKRFFRRLLKGLQYVSRVIITDKLKRGSGSSKGDMVMSNDGHSYFAMSTLPERTTSA